jgi:hypothetical protein
LTATSSSKSTGKERDEEVDLELRRRKQAYQAGESQDQVVGITYDSSLGAATDQTKGKKKKKKMASM